MWVRTSILEFIPNVEALAIRMGFGVLNYNYSIIYPKKPYSRPCLPTYLITNLPTWGSEKGPLCRELPYRKATETVLGPFKEPAKKGDPNSELPATQVLGDFDGFLLGFGRRSFRGLRDRFQLIRV